MRQQVRVAMILAWCVAAAGTLAQPRTPTQAAAPRFREPEYIECRSGQPKAAAERSTMRCASPNGVGVSVDVPPSSYVYENNPACSQRSLDRVMRSLLSAAAAERARAKSAANSEFTAFWTSLRQRVMAANSVNSESADLLMGTVPPRSAAVCRAVLVPVPVRPTSISSLDFRAGSARDVSGCFSGRIGRGASSAGFPSTSQSPTVAYTVAPGSGPCAVGWSAWEAAGVVADGQGGAIVGAVFKNWSHNLTRTAQLWVSF